MSLNIRKGDNVLVIAGKDKGKSGKVLVAMPADNSVVVAGVNIVAKHKKPKSANDKGGIIKKEGKINASNVEIICLVCGKATRVAHKIVDGKSTRVCKKCGASLDTASKTTKKTTTTKSTPTKKTEVAKEVKAEKPATKTVAKTTTKSSTKTAETKTAEKKTTATKTTTKKSTAKKVESK